MAGSMRKLAGQTATYGISSVLARLLSFVMSTFFFTSFMTTAQFGVYNHIYSFMPFAMVLLTMGMESGYLRFAGKEDSASGKDKVFATAWGAVSFVSVIFFVVIMLFRPQIASVMGYADRGNYIWLMGGIIALDAIAAIPYARLREQGRARRYVVVRTLSVVMQVALCVFFYVVWPRVSGPAIFANPADPGYAFLANLISSFITLVILLPDCDGILPRVDRKLFRRIFLYSLPLLISGILGTANEYIDRQFIKFLFPGQQGEEMLGIYSVPAKIASLMVLFTQMYKYAAEPFFLADFKKDDFKKSNAEAMKYYIIVSIFIFLALALYPDLIGKLLGKDFREGMPMLPVMLISNVMTGVILNLSFWYKQIGATKYSILITSVGLVFTVVFNLLLTPRLGVWGAALARLICESVMVCVSYALNRKHYPIPYDLKRIGEYVLLGAAIYFIATALSGLTMWLRYFVYLVLIAIFVVYAVWRERIDVRGLLSSVLNKKK